MKFTMLIRPDGKAVTEVLDRQDSVCENIKQVTNALGHEDSDEHHDSGGCDPVREVQLNDS